MHGKQSEELSSLLLPGICSSWEGLCRWNCSPCSPWICGWLLYTAWRVDLVHLLGFQLALALYQECCRGVGLGGFFSLLCSQLRASISQQCSHRSCIPSLRMKTCGVLLVVLTSVSWPGKGLIPLLPSVSMRLRESRQHITGF